MSVSRRALMGLALAAPVLAACGTTEAARTAAPTGSATSGGSIRLTDSRGVTVTLAQPATKVVTLEWGPTEDVLALGVTPVAVADPTNFTVWNSAVTLPAGTPDVGLRTEPSLESIAKAEPDLILGVTGSIPEAAIAQVEKIAPVFLLQAADASRQIDLMRENFTTTARLLGKESAATPILAAFDAKVAEGTQKLAGVTSPYIFTYISVTGATASLRMHSDGSLPGAVAKAVGLTNAWTDAGDASWGLGSLDLEGLTTFPADTTVLYWANASDDPIGALQGNALWEGLPFVQAGRVKPAADRIWIYGGPSSMIQWIDDLVAKLA